MLSYPIQWVPTTALVLVYLTQSTHTTTVSLLDLMPKCASECLESFISTDYPRNACSKGCDLNYLCTKNTTSGYTLGEAALRCSLSLCSTGVSLSFDTYTICDSVPGALPQTHPTIIATITSPAKPTSTTTEPTTIIITQSGTTDTRSTIDPTSTKADHTSTITTFQSPASATHSTLDPSSIEPEEPTSTELTNSSPSATSSENSSASNLNSGAVIGVSVASGIAGFFIIGVIIIFCCRKIRHKAQDGEFFEIGGHMSEPPDFSFPPERPPMGPRPSPGTLNTDSESARLVPPVDAEYGNPAPYPAVIVTEPEEDYDYGRISANNADRSGFQHSSSNPDFDAASIASSRTVSDLLPDKPTYELYPRPLRWSQHKKSRPSSRVTLFEEENHTRSRKPPSPSLQPSNFTPRSDRGQNRKPMAGLPANPRAMMYGFGRPGQTIAMKRPGNGKRPVYSNVKENIQPSRQADLHGIAPYRPGHMDYDDGLSDYWQNSDAGFVGAKVIQPHTVARGAGMNRNSFGDYPGYDFEFGFSDIGSDSRRASRHSGSFRPLTPVREIRTPMGEVQNPTDKISNDGNKQMRQAPNPPSGLLNQPQEIVSRPRIVRQNDIKRVEIRRGKPSSKEVTAPYCPDDYWFEQSSELSAAYNPPKDSGGYRYAPKGILGMPTKKPLPLERNLTPSRRGADLILQVE